MDEVKTKVCIDCKRKLPETEEYFTAIKKSKYGLNNRLGGGFCLTFLASTI